MKKNNTVFGSAVLVMIVVLGSKFLGFLRQVVIAGTYGADMTTDIYFMSSDFIIGLSGALLASLTTALVTVYIDISVKKDKDSANAVASKMLTLFLASGCGFIILINLFAPYIARILAPNYTKEQYVILIKYLRLFSVTFIFTSFQSIYAAVLNANNSFVPGKLYGIVYNPIAIGFVLLFAGRFGINALIAAYIIANILQTLLLKLLCRNTFRFRPSLDLTDEAIKHLIMLSLPLLLSNIFIQLNGIIDKAICSYLGEGFASDYSYAYTLEQFVTATVTATVSLILLSRYATYVAENNTPMVIRSFKESISGLIILLSAITAVACALSYEIASIVYLRGEFDAAAAKYTSEALVGFSIGFSLIAVREMYIRLHFSYQNTKMPMRANIAAVILNAVLSFILAKFIGIMGISLATSLSVILTIAMLNRSVKEYIPDFKFSSMLPLIIKVSVAALGAFGISYFIKEMLGGINILVRFCVSAAGGGAAYCAVLFILRCNEAAVLLKSALSQISKKLTKH